MKSALGISSSGSELQLELGAGDTYNKTFSIKPMIVIAVGRSRGTYATTGVTSVAIRTSPSTTTGYCAVNVAWADIGEYSAITFSNNSISRFPIPTRVDIEYMAYAVIGY